MAVAQLLLLFPSFLPSSFSFLPSMSLPASVTDAVLVTSTTPTSEKIKGYDFNQGIDYQALFASYKTTGFQASSLALAIEEINRMVPFSCSSWSHSHWLLNISLSSSFFLLQRKWRLSDDPIPEDASEEDKDPKYRAETKCKIYLAYTSNMISCGMREILRFLVQHKMVSSSFSSILTEALAGC